jgi:hypothetical protein
MTMTLTMTTIGISEFCRKCPPLILPYKSTIQFYHTVKLMTAQ